MTVEEKPSRVFGANELIDHVIKDLWLIVCITLVGAFISVLVALWIPNKYTSYALLAPSDSGSGGLSGLMRQYGGLASIAGVDIGGGEQSGKSELAVELLSSRKFSDYIVEKYKLRPALLAPKKWERDTNTLLFDEKLYNKEEGKWVRKVPPPRKRKPSLEEAHIALSKILSVSEDRRTGFVSISITHLSPFFAKELVSIMFNEVNEVIREQDISEAKKSIEFLNAQAADTSLADLQMIFFNLIQNQTETMMLANVRSEYVFKYIDPPTVPELKSSPNRALLCIAITLLFGIFSIGISVVRLFLKLR